MFRRKNLPRRQELQYNNNSSFLSNISAVWFAALKLNDVHQRHADYFAAVNLQEEDLLYLSALVTRGSIYTLCKVCTPHQLGTNALFLFSSAKIQRTIMKYTGVFLLLLFGVGTLLFGARTGAAAEMAEAEDVPSNSEVVRLRCV